MRRLRSADLDVGQPSSWAEFDKSGRLPPSRGSRIECERQIERVAAGSLFIQGQDFDVAGGMDAPANAFGWLMAAARGMEALLHEIRGGAPDGIRRLRQKADKIMSICAADADAALAAIHLDFHNPYVFSHPVHVAVLSDLVGRRLGVGHDERLSILCAALTADLGMRDFQDLERQAAALDPEQTAAVRRHALRSALLLEEAGVDDPLWLDAVLHHHERWNGQGYPDRLARLEIPLGARIIAVADSYAAQVFPRPCRHVRSPFEALGDIFRSMGVLYDPNVCGALTKEIGMHPPGSCIRLPGGETAVVKARPADDGDWPLFAIRGTESRPYLEPLSLDAAGFGVAVPWGQPESHAVESIVLTLWN